MLCKVSEDFPIQCHAFLFKPVHEFAVRESVAMSRGSDSHLPERAEIALLGLAIAEGVLPSVINRIGSVAIKFGAAHPEALGGCDHPFAAFAGSWGVGYSHLG